MMPTFHDKGRIKATIIDLSILEYLDEAYHHELIYDKAHECFLGSFLRQKLSYRSTRRKITMKAKTIESKLNFMDLIVHTIKNRRKIMMKEKTIKSKLNFILVSVFLSKITYLQLLVVSH